MNQAQVATEQCTPRPDLGSILRAMPDDPGLKVRYAVRRVLNITLKEFALRLGVKRTQLYEGGIRDTRPSWPLRTRIAAALGVELTDIWPASELESSSTVAQAQAKGSESETPEITHV